MCSSDLGSVERPGRADGPGAVRMLKEHPEVVTGIGEWYVDPTADLKLDKLDSFYDPLRTIAKVLNLDLKKLAG